MYSRKMLPALDVDQIMFEVFTPTVEPLVVNSSIVLKFGKLWRISNIKNGENVIKKPLAEKKAVLGQSLYLRFSRTISEAMIARIVAR